MKNKYCEECIFCDLVDWELDEKKEHATPIYWCEKKHTYCEDVKECKERNKG